VATRPKSTNPSDERVLVLISSKVSEETGNAKENEEGGTRVRGGAREMSNPRTKWTPFKNQSLKTGKNAVSQIGKTK